MGKSSITAFTLEHRTEQTGWMGNRTLEDEVIRMDTPGGSIFLRESAVEGAGDSWQRIKGRIYHLAAEKNIPFTEEKREE